MAHRRRNVQQKAWECNDGVVVQNIKAVCSLQKADMGF
jgi:hypothetical protein